MADEHQQPERAWDEYEWERFLQQQDRKTERYMELLERYIDDPKRDEIIAREMGWNHLVDDEEDDVDALGEDELSELGDLDDEEDVESSDDDLDDDLEDEEEAEEETSERFESHPLYQAAFSLTLWIDGIFEDNEPLQNDPGAVRITTQAAIASAKLAAALSDDDIDEIGMTIAYLKRALKAVTGTLDGAVTLHAQGKISNKVYTELRDRIFQVRDGVVTLMGQFREEWRRRYGGN